MMNEVKTVIAAITPEKINFFLIGSGSLLSMRRAAAHSKPKIQTPRIISQDPSAIIDKESGVFGCKPVERFNIRKTISIVSSITRSGAHKIKNPGMTGISAAKDANLCSGSISLPKAQVRKTLTAKGKAAATALKISLPAIRLIMKKHPLQIVAISRTARLLG